MSHLYDPKFPVGILAKSTSTNMGMSYIFGKVFHKANVSIKLVNFGVFTGYVGIEISLTIKAKIT